MVNISIKTQSLVERMIIFRKTILKNTIYIIRNKFFSKKIFWKKNMKKKKTKLKNKNKNQLWEFGLLENMETFCKCFHFGYYNL